MDLEDRARKFTTKRFARKFKEIIKTTRFTTSELSSLINIYINLSDLRIGLGCAMSQSRFLLVMDCFYEITNTDVILEYIKQFQANLPKDRHISLMFWIAMNNFILRSTLDEKIDFCLKYYDKLNYGLLTRDVAVEGISKTIMDSSDEDLAQDVGQILFDYFDKKGNGVIQYEKFRELVHRKPDLLQCFGKFLPDPLCVQMCLEPIILQNRFPFY